MCAWILQKDLKIPTIGIRKPGDKVLRVLAVLYDSGDRVAFPLEVEWVETDIIGR